MKADKSISNCGEFAVFKPIEIDGFRPSEALMP